MARIKENKAAVLFEIVGFRSKPHRQKSLEASTAPAWSAGVISLEICLLV
jgi:hypothetical protein